MSPEEEMPMHYAATFFGAVLCGQAWRRQCQEWDWVTCRECRELRPPAETPPLSGPRQPKRPRGKR